MLTPAKRLYNAMVVGGVLTVAAIGIVVLLWAVTGLIAIATGSVV